MNTTLYYFSGAGNSLQVARDLVAEVGGDGTATSALNAPTLFDKL